MARKLVKSEVIEIVIPKGSTGSKIQLPDIPNLRNVHLINIETYYQESMPKSPVSSNNVIPFALARVIFLTLQSYNGKNFMWQRWLISFVNAFNGGLIFSWFPIMFVGQKVNFPKSYIEIMDITQISATEDQALLLDITYSETAAKEAKDKESNFSNQS